MTDFSLTYVQCDVCSTLISRSSFDESITQVVDDEHDFYGRSYYETRLLERNISPPIEERARHDLYERNLYWLRYLLAYRHPPGRVLELGCAHGSFVALLRWTGFDAMGLELSPWLVQLAKDTFDIPMLQGPIE